MCSAGTDDIEEIQPNAQVKGVAFGGGVGTQWTGEEGDEVGDGYELVPGLVLGLVPGTIIGVRQLTCWSCRPRVLESKGVETRCMGGRQTRLVRRMSSFWGLCWDSCRVGGSNL